MSLGLATNGDALSGVFAIRFFLARGQVDVAEPQLSPARAGPPPRAAASVSPL